MASKLIVLLVAPAVLASPGQSSSRFLGQRENGRCEQYMGSVMREVLGYTNSNYTQVKLNGTLTGNLPSVPHIVGLPDNLLKKAPEIPQWAQIYGNNQTSIRSPREHCTKQANDYNENDFKDAWRFLGCELQHLLANPVVASAFEAAVQGLAQLVENADSPPVSYPNPWIGATPEDFITFFEEYFWFLPQPTGTEKSGLVYILKENYFERDNMAAIHFLNTFKSMTAPAKEYTTEIFDWTYKWVTARGILMDSNYSTKVIGNWTRFNDAAEQSNNTNVMMSDYQYYNANDKVGYGYKSFNQFFSRRFVKAKKSRPVSQPDAAMVVTAPGDVEINFIYARLRAETKIPVKGIHNFNIDQLLDGSKYASRFIGGTAVSCVLMPYAYHNFHSPVSGELIEARDVPGALFGIPDGAAWFGSGNTGTSVTNFNLFGGFHRAYFVYDTGKYGLVAQIAVGLADVSSICGSVGSHVGWVEPGSCCCEEAAKLGKCDPSRACEKIQKGDHVGYFAYGGSLNILLFEAGAFNSMNVLMGNRIGSLSPSTLASHS